MSDKELFEIFGREIGRGETFIDEVPITQMYSGSDVLLPICVKRGKREGPVVFVTAAVHGDELNGVGIVQELAQEGVLDVCAGTVILVPVVNVLGFDRQSRYMPDRRDLNRSFPGFEEGSLAARFAHKLFTEIVARCDYGIDLHSAGGRRTNYPNVRGDMNQPEVARLARAFGCEVIIDGAGPKGSLREAATKAGTPTMILEAGEVWRVEPGMVWVGVRGVQQVLGELGMVDVEPYRPAHQVVVSESKWVRARAGGFLRFHVGPGDLVRAGQAIATNRGLLGDAKHVLVSPVDGIVLGMTTLPAVVPGEPVCHLAVVKEGIEEVEAGYRKLADESSHTWLREHLMSNIMVTEPTGEPRSHWDESEMEQE